MSFEMISNCDVVFFFLKDGLFKAVMSLCQV